MSTTTIQLQQIDLSAIDLSEKWNLHPFLPAEPPTTLTNSIEAIGLLHPVILKKKGKARFQLISGRYRFKVCSTLVPKKKTLPALILDDRLSLKQVLRILLEEQLLSSPLSPMELAYFFSYCLQSISIDNAAEYFLPLLQEKPQSHKIQQLLLLLDLEPKLQRSVHHNKIGVKTAYELLKLPTSDRETLHNLFHEFELGGGKQKRLLALCSELAARKEETITTLLTGKEYFSIFAHREMNKPQKLATLLALLQNNLFPQSLSMETKFQDAVRQIKLPSTCSVDHSPAFERDEIYLTVRFSDLSALVNNSSAIKNITEKN